MREIKFRAWDAEDGVMFYSRPADFCLMIADRVDKKYNVIMEGHLSVVAKHHPLMQFAGLTDKNGKDIYEGDIVAQYRGDEWETIRTVQWRNDRCGFWLYFPNRAHLDLGAHREKLEVIGNIYEHPELLK